MIKGFKHSAETKKKMSQTHKKVGTGLWMKGKIRSAETQIKMNKAISKAKTGKKFTVEHRKNLSIAHTGKTGKKASNWQGGKTDINNLSRGSKKYVIWRQSVFIRDSFTCVRCKKKGGDLIAHHINNWAEYKNLRFDCNNGITICKECHDLFHIIYSRYNNNIDQLVEFI